VTSRFNWSITSLFVGRVASPIVAVGWVTLEAEGFFDRVQAERPRISSPRTRNAIQCLSFIIFSLAAKEISRYILQILKKY
jgi:hypothetical protein